PSVFLRRSRLSRRLSVVDESNDGAVDAELTDVFDDFERAKTRCNRLRDVVPDDGEAVNHDRDDEAEADAFADARSLAFVSLRIGERERQAREELRGQSNRQQRGDVGRTPVGPRVGLIQAQQPDVVNQVTESDGGDPGRDARERNPRVVHGGELYYRPSSVR